jgi:hypothetical protein
MEVSKITEVTIFESPDGGKTVTARIPQTLTKKNVTLDILEPEKIALQEKWLIWKDILWASRTNSALTEALDRAQIIYELSRCDKD